MNTFFDKIKENSAIDNTMQTGFSKFSECLKSYLDLFEHLIIYEESLVKIYGSVTLENGAIMRAISSYHGRAWFSNIAISMNSEESNDYMSDQGICYGQVLLTIYLCINIYLLINYKKYL